MFYIYSLFLRFAYKLKFEHGTAFLFQISNIILEKDDFTNQITPVISFSNIFLNATFCFYDKIANRSFSRYNYII